VGTKMKKFKLEFVGIEKNYLEEEIDVLICETDLGEISILADHHPLITVVKKGEIKIKKDNEEKTIFLPFDSILEVKENKARILVMFPI
jgi:F0F1-type ATP synthase epsilon subunit